MAFKKWINPKTGLPTRKVEDTVIEEVTSKSEEVSVENVKKEVKLEKKEVYFPVIIKETKEIVNVSQSQYDPLIHTCL